MPKIPDATPAMHPRQSWRDGYNDAVRGRNFAFTFNGFQTVRGDSASEMYYADGYTVGSERSRRGIFVRHT